MPIELSERRAIPSISISTHTLRLRWFPDILIVDWIWVLAPTAGSFGSVIAALTHCHASFNREVAQDTGQEQGEERHGDPADAAVGLRAREWLVRARVLVVAGAVVEKAFYAADACPVLHCTICWAHTPPAAHPTGREHPWATAIWTLTLAAVLTPNRVFTLISIDTAARHHHYWPGLLIQGFQLLWVQFGTLGLCSDYLFAVLWAADKPLVWRNASHAGPDAAMGVVYTGRLHSTRRGRVSVQVAEIIRPLFLSLLLSTAS